ncbi:MAG TPA: RNA methyltransferase [bacterium]|nr:RNA methyltransferase [bacterium]HPP87079.1 RNA methyltransferase [bacterium]
MNYSKQILELVAILKNIFRFAMFNYKGSISIAELNEWINKLDDAVNNKFSELLANSKKYDFLKNEISNIKRFSENAEYFKLANLANNLYHKISELNGKQIKEYDFQILNSDTQQQKSENYLKNNIILALDNIRSPFNVGAFFRIADAAGIAEIILCGFTPAPDNNKVKRAAMQTDNFINWRYFKYAEEMLEYLQQKKIAVTAVETTNTAKNYFDVSFNQSTALIFGNEEFGVNENILARADNIIKIPMFGRKNSLNVAVSAGIILFHILTKIQN